MTRKKGFDHEAHPTLQNCLSHINSRCILYRIVDSGLSKAVWGGQMKRAIISIATLCHNIECT
jgi:hypothetical protein